MNQEFVNSALPISDLIEIFQIESSSEYINTILKNKFYNFFF